MSWLEDMDATTRIDSLDDGFEPEISIFGDPTPDDLHLEGVDPDAYRDRLIEDGWL